jgi:hypothetical protein
MAKSNVSWKKRLGILLIGLIANQFIVYLGDYVLYPWVMGTQGFLVGANMMLWLSTLICLLTLKFYDWSGKDWIGIETLKEARELENSKANHLIARFFKKSQTAQLVILSLAQDPFIVTVFLREGAHQYGKMTKRDWKNFFVSVLVANAFWSTVCWSGVKILESVGLQLGLAITILSFVLIGIAVAGLIIGKLSEKRESKKVGQSA